MFKYQITEDMDLRILELRHAEIVYQLVDENRNYLGKWLPWVDFTRSVEDSKDFIKLELNRFSNNKGFSSGIFYKNQFVGCISIHDINWNHKKTSIGYWIGKQFQGLGLMTTACKYLTEYAFSELMLNRIEINACMENSSSRRVAERLGYKHEGTIRQVEFINGRYYDHVLYGMTADQWKTI